MSTVFVVCRLPQGLLIDHPKDPRQSIELLGQNSRHKGKIIINNLYIDDYGLTEVNKDLWDAWEMENLEFPAYANGLIFAAKTKKEAEQEYINRSRDATGFEQLDPAKIDPGLTLEK